MKAEPLLKTKLFIPPLGPLVSRPRLVAQLDDGILRALTLISAPPGYGKTTLVVEWLHQTARPCTWLALDEGDNDPVRFFNYFIAALQKNTGPIGEAAMSLLALPQLPPVEVIVTALINDLASSPDSDSDNTQDSGARSGAGCVMVLDDYHAIHAPLIHVAMEFFVLHAPPGMHLVLLSRVDPPFSLARLRVRGQVTEIRAGDLRFTPEESARFFNDLKQLQLDAEALSILESRTEGWIAGLQLAALSLHGQNAERVTDFIQAFGGSHRYIIDYLLDEVLRRQSEELRRFLRQTAILNRFNAPLCDAVTGGANSETVLDQLEQANLFLVPLDPQRGWYRYHHLFAGFLRTELSPDERKILHRKAALWYQETGWHAEAIEHALAANDTETAACSVEQAAGEAFQKGELVTLRRWLDALPETAIHANLNLTAYKAHLLSFAGQWATAASLVPEQPRWTNSADPAGRGRLMTLSAGLAGIREDLALSATLAHQALDLIGDADPFFRLVALQRLGDAQHQAGDTAAASRTFGEAYELGQELDKPFAALMPFISLIPNLNRQGRRRQALAYCQRALARYVDARRNPLPLARLIYVPLAILHYAADELEPAYAYVREGLAAYQELALDKSLLGDGEWVLTQIQCARGEREEALSTAREARLAAEKFGQPRMALIMASVEADVQLKLGDTASAAQWVEIAERTLPIPPRSSYEMAYFILARMLLSQHRLEEAQILLGHLKQSAEHGERNGRLITIYILQALAHHMLGNQDAALYRLDSALQIAAPEDYRRAFLDEGPLVAELLPQVRDRAPEFVANLSEAFAGQDSRQRDDKSTAILSTSRETVGGNESFPSSESHRPSSGVGGAPSQVEPLSDRELEVLRLLAEGKSNAEIAQALVVTVGTAKWHVHHILEKLGAGNRTQAIARARELGLI